MKFKCKAREFFFKIKSKYIRIIFIFIVIIFLMSCNVSVRYPSEFPSKTKISFVDEYWFWGLIGEKNYEVYNICKGGRIYEIKIKSSISQKTFTILTLGIYSPRTTTFVCSIRGEE